MLNVIQKLPNEVINQISAGEVVERPAGLVKELIENSLDAGATKLEIHFSDGGRFVQIKDNGHGIRSADLLLAVSPNSTSKISSVSDIWSINSYGFRGEALASIAEVSDLTLISRPEEQKLAGQLRIEFGKKSRVESVNSKQGTIVIVKNLFEKIPARLKFLKSEASETALIKNTIKAMALSHPEVEFRVLHKNKLLFYWPEAENLQKRVEAILSLKEPFYTRTKYQDMEVEAVFCAPNQTASNRKQMWFFVDGRWVEDTTIYSAVIGAYRGLLMHGEYPIVVLKLLCPHEDLDVNIHPAKSKIRFKNSSPVFKAVHHCLRSVLEKAPWLKNKMSAPDEQELTFPNKEFNQVSFEQKSFEQKTFKPKATHLAAFQKTEPMTPILKRLKMEAIPESVSTKSRETYSKDFCSKDFCSKDFWSSLSVLSQAHLTYVIAQNREAIIFIDQHAAHERVLYEKLMLSWNTGKGEIQNRLIPLALDLDESLVKAIFSVQKELKKLGLEVERSGPDGLVIHSAPSILKDVALQKSLIKLADEIRSLGGSFALENKISDLCATMACHSAIRAGKALSLKEMQELLIQMDEFPLSSFCPHGRPVFVEYALSRLEKDFGRRV